MSAAVPRRARMVPWWALVSSALAPLALVLGWSIAAAVQPPGFDPVSQTISALASHGAAHRWIMTAGLYTVGVCHVVTAAGLGAVRLAARLALALAGVAGVGVAVFAQPAHGSSPAHIASAAVSMATLTLWPLLVVSTERDAPKPQQSGIAVTATVILSALLGWLFGTLHGGATLGVAERLGTFGQAVWPFVVVVEIRRRQSRSALALGG